jgi:hypothetical protein
MSPSSFILAELGHDVRVNQIHGDYSKRSTGA